MRKQVWRTLLVLLLVLSMLPGSEVFPDGSWSIMTEAAGKQKAFTENPKLSKTKCNLNNKKSTVVTVKGTKKSFSVGSSDKTIATVKKTGKYTFKITAAKKKKGRAVIFVKTFKGYRYALVTVGKKTTMSSKTKAWAIKAGFIKQRETEKPQPETEKPQPQTEKPQPETEKPQPQTEKPQPQTEEQESEQKFDLSKVPAYAGNPAVIVNNNVPFFKESEITTHSFEFYGDLDSLGRCTKAFACVGTDLMPTAARGEIGTIRPTGWHLVKYDGIDGNYLYNRCHLIAYELTAENANVKNLITGTRYLNTQGMLPYENKVADYVKATGHHVMYRVTPIFAGNNLLASGVLMEGRSVEDNVISFCVYAYNVQPGITIDYATGDSSGPEYPGREIAKYDGVNFSSPAVIKYVQKALNSAGYYDGPADGVIGSQTAEAVERYRADKGISGSGIDAYLAFALGLNAYDLLSIQNETEAPPETEPAAPSGNVTTYVVNTNTGKFHYPGCSSVRRMSKKNRMDFTGTRDQLLARGYQPCKICNP